MVNSQTPPQPDWLVAAVQRVFKPIVRLLVGRMACPVAIDLLKEAYIAEATRQLINEEGRKRATKSALALKTGLDTRVIASLEAAPRSETVSAADLTSEAAVLHAWSSHKDFVDPASGKPRDINIYGRRGTFQNLVMRYAGRNVTCPTVLTSLTAGGNVELVGNDHVRLLNPHFGSTTDEQRVAIESGSVALERMGRHVVHGFRNETGTESTWPQQARTGKNLPAAALKDLPSRLDQLLSSQADAAEAVLEAQPAAEGDEESRTAGICSFYWEES